MAPELDRSDERPNGSRTHSVWVPLLAALIIGSGAIVAAVIARSTASETTTVVKTVPAPETPPPPAPQAEPESDAPDASESEADGPPEAEQPTATVPCLSSPAGNDAEDSSMGRARGPLASGRVYRGTLIKGDEEWWGFCASRPGRVDVRVENVCGVEGSGPTNLIAEVLAPSGEWLETMRPDPGRFALIPLQVQANKPYYVHIFDINDIDVGEELCGEVPWALTVTGDLASEVPVESG